MLDEMFHVFKQLKEDDFNVQCIVTQEILHIAQHHCTEWRRGGKAKGQTSGDAFPHINFQDVAWLERLASAIYDRVFIPGRAPDMSGYQDWDCIVVGTLVSLIYQGKMVWDHGGPTTIAGANAQRGNRAHERAGPSAL